MCGHLGIPVKNVTVETISGISTENNKMSLCQNPICELVYFGSDFYPLVFMRTISTPLHFKEEETIHYICYCHKITYDAVKKKVLHEGVRKIKALMPVSCDIIISDCERKHPLGCTCANELNRYINQLLKDHALI